MPPLRRLPAALAVVTVAAVVAALAPAVALAAPAALVRPLAVPQGVLASTACTRVGTADTCELFAKPGTATVAGTSVPIWGLASTDAAPVGTPGPVLVVTQGDTVTVNLHNGLPGALSLAVPQMTGLASDTAGAATGAAKAYTFTASRPGTYLYEAGHTPDGARQAAMGVVGALVVRPTAGPGSAYGDAPSAFDDEAVLVLSEIDPALNAAPTTFDLRNYHPRYKLINGKAFPETDPVSTDSGRRVLLRYVNAGLTDHAMGVTGARQLPVGIDARANADAYPLVADTIAPGQTEDAITVVPPADDGPRFAVYETTGRLDNNGSRTGPTSNQVAFGGMMTFLATNAGPPTTDVLGPATSAVTVAPAAVTALGSVTLTATLSDAANGNANVTAAEYVIDNPGAVNVGAGTPLTGAFGTPTVTGATATIGTTVLQTLAQGTHTVFVRALDANGNWGPPSAATFSVTRTGPVTTAGTVTPAVTNGAVDVALRATGDDSGLGGTVAAAEYFVGAQGVNGAGVAMTLAPTANPAVAAESATIPATVITTLPNGATSVYVHTKDSFGLWGPPQVLTLTVTRTGPTASALTVDPNPTDGTVGSAVDPTQLKVTGTFTEPGTPAPSTVAGAEGFLDTPGADGTGFVFVAADGQFNTATETAYGLIPLSQVTGLADGAHQIYVHARDAAGNWGALAPVTLTVDHGVVVSAVTAAFTPAGPNITTATTAIALSATATSATGAPQAAEWFADADPGAGKGRPMAIAPSGTAFALTASVPPGGLSVGQHTLSVRARSAAGTWGKPAFTTVTVASLSNLLFADGFTASTANWAGQVGTPQVTGGQLQPAPGTYVVDTTPINEAVYSASFLFTPGGLTTAGNATATVFEALTTANGQVLAVQYQKTATGYRVRLARGGASSNWVAVGNVAAHTITVKFTAANGTATIAVTGGTGVTGSPVTWTTNTPAVRALRVDTVRLGVTAGGTGSPLIDTFTSSRI